MTAGDCVRVQVLVTGRTPGRGKDCCHQQSVQTATGAQSSSRPVGIWGRILGQDDCRGGSPKNKQNCQGRPAFSSSWKLIMI
jgi:hypothetical protein